MAAVPLLFERAPATSAALLFGDDGGGIADTPAQVAATLPKPTALVWAIKDNEASVSATLPSPTVAAHLVWDANTYRPTVAKSVGVYQRAIPGLSPATQRYQRSGLLPIGHAADYERAWPLLAGRLGRYTTTLQTPQALQGVYQRATPHGGLLCSSHYESALHLPTGLISAYQRAMQLQTWLVQQRYQEAIRVRCDTRQLYQRAWPVSRGFGSGMGKAATLLWVLQAIYQRAWPPRPGMWDGIAPEPPKKPPCYLPNTALLFVAPIATNGALLFICERKTPAPPGPQQPPNYVLKILRRGYMTIHHLTAQLLPSLEAVKLRNITIASDDDSFGWSLSASGPEHLLDQLAPVGGLPAQIRIVIDGIDWVFSVESLTRSRKFVSNGVAVQGRSTPALLGAPYMPESTWGNPDGDYTAQQLVAQALEYTGVEIDWGITDWLVNQGAWSYQGTPLAVAARVAESVGAVLRSHRTLPTLQFADRYPHMPWEWASAPVNVQMPVSITTTDSLQPTNKPDWNAMYVSGTNYGVLGHIRRAGTAGDVLAPQVTDALITHGDAARQRGRAILGSAGKQMRHTLSLPLLVGVTGATGPVLIEPGYLIEVIEKKETWRGQVRAVSVSANLPLVRQSITVERHAA